MKKKILFITLLIFIYNCDKKDYPDFPNSPNNDCEIEDSLGDCCSEEELDCNNICNGNSQLDLCGECNGYNTTCIQNECNEENAINFTEDSTNNLNCINNDDIYLPQDSNWQWWWGDEFNTQTLDLSKWEYQIGNGSNYGLDNWGNNEKQYYTSDNVSLESCSDGIGNCLVIKAIQETYNTPNGDAIDEEYTSGRIKSINSGNFLYGKIDIRAKIPSGDGTWPAFWMLPTNPEEGWPASGEIDIMEYTGCSPNEIITTAHCLNNHASNGVQASTSTSSINDYNHDGFNTYSIEWNEDSILWFINGSQVHNFPSSADPNAWPFNKYFHIILNLAVGGDFANCDIDNDAFFIGQKLEIDFVRVFKKIE